MSKVLVTGAAGFIGSHVIRALLDRGDDVTGLVRKTSPLDRLRSLGIKLVYGDVTDGPSLAAAVRDVQTVYHLAGCTLALRAERYYQINEQGVRNLAEVCAAQDTPPVLVTVSSLAAAGPAPDDRLRTPDDPPAPVSHYGRSKRAGELVAERFADRMPITIVRPPIVLGEADRYGLPMFRSIAWFGVHAVPALGRRRYSVIHAADLARLLILAAERGSRLRPVESGIPSSAGYYFAAGDEHPSYAELGRMIGTALGRRRVLIVPTPPRAVWVTAALVEVGSRLAGRPGYLSFDKAREVRAGSWLCSAQTAVDELQFSVAAPLSARLRQTADWYRREKWL